MTRWLRQCQPILLSTYFSTLGIHKVVVWLEMVSVQPAKPTIISVLWPQIKPKIDVYKPLYKGNVVNTCLALFAY